MRLEVVRAPETLEVRIATLVMEPDLRVRIVEAQRRNTLLEKKTFGSEDRRTRKFSQGGG